MNRMLFDAIEARPTQMLVATAAIGARIEPSSGYIRQGES
jgi:hypothetical protein